MIDKHHINFCIYLFRESRSKISHSTLVHQGCNLLIFLFGVSFQSTPLHLAAGYNRIAIVQLLLQHGADVHAKDKG